MHEEKTEGIVLRSQDYKERHRIITLFTPQGLTSLIVRGISRKNARLLTLTSPFCHGEYLYRKGHSELLSFRDGAVLDDHFHLRSSLKSLQTAGSLATAILTSQLPGKPAHALFTLYKLYHKHIAHFQEPDALIASFYLKLLKHEGLLSLSPTCASCDNPSHRLREGESFCSQHSMANDIPFSLPEWDLLLALDNCSQFSILRSLSLSPHLAQKIHSLFLSRLNS